MQLLPASPRRRRRLAWAVGAGTAVVTLLLVAVLLPDRNSRIDRFTAVPAAREQGPAPPASNPRHVKLTRPVRAQVTDAPDRFILTGVAGKKADEAWGLKPGERAKVLAQPDLTPSIVGAGEQRISANWLFLPLDLLAGMIVLIPAAVAVSTWCKNRAVARYLDDERVRERRAA